VYVTVALVVVAGACLVTETEGRPVELAHTESKSEFKKRRVPWVSPLPDIGVLVLYWCPPR
jgi:hypothetical protein